MRAKVLQIGAFGTVAWADRLRRPARCESVVPSEQQSAGFQVALPSRIRTEKVVEKSVDCMGLRPVHRFSTPSYVEKALRIAAKGGVVDVPSWHPMSQFDREYKLEGERELGSGGCGRVCLAMHKTGVSRAVKMVNADGGFNDRALQQELDIMRRLQHCQHVVNVIDAFADDTNRYMVMELCYGLDLVESILEEFRGTEETDRLAQHPNLPHVAAVFREMVTAVAECHERGVCHMDIKPENFIHTSTESHTGGGASIKLLDFGLAWPDTEPRKISRGTQLGCSKYLAPELFRTGHEVTPKPCDMYALGVSLFNLLTGSFPYSFGRMGRPQSRPDLSLLTDPAAKDLIEQLLSSDPTKRLSTKEVLQHEFLRKHKDAKVTPLSQLTGRGVKSLFTEECACAVPTQCCHRASARNFNKDDVLFREGDRSRAVYVVTKGSFNVVRNGSIVGTLQADSIVGEMGALFDQPRGATVLAADDTAEVLEFKDFGKKLGSTQQRYALKGFQEKALKEWRRYKLQDLLRSSLLFQDASAELLDMVIAGSDHVLFNEGDKVLEAGDDKMALYFVQEGSLELRKSATSQASSVMPGEIVGEMAVVFGQRGSETLMAEKPTTALVLDRAQFALILGEFPEERDKLLARAELHLQAMGLQAELA